MSILIKTKNIIKKIFINLKLGFIKTFNFIKKLIINLKEKKKNKTKKDNKKEIKYEIKKIEEVKEDIEIEPKKFKLESTRELVLQNNGKNAIRSLTGRVIPRTFLKGDRKIRKTIYVKESIIFMLIITLIDFIGFYKTKYLDMLHIFDNSIWNIVVTITLTMLITFIGVYIIDYTLTEIILRNKKRKR